MHTSHSLESGIPTFLKEQDRLPVKRVSAATALRREHIQDLLDGMGLVGDAVRLDDPTPEDLELIAGALDEEREEGE